ncbi:periplasmic protein [Pseudomonas putida]|uniref:chalcone isomerase family protein n=1 Tax=Pseudomonas putida TaxID=303 RepID=UPI0007B6A291|nr:chalcone isomerase family protein [Pseudomonas putida]ANC03043.1 periplasmic protein [Pseudomonas putida]
MVHRARWTCLCLLIVAFSATADWRSQLPGAQRLGAGEFTWFGLRLYTAQLWTLGPALDWNQPFALELLYHRSLSKDTLVQASLEEMHRLNASGIAPQQRPAWTQALEAAFVDVRPGMRITGLYLPGQGCRFYVEGELSREINDPAFARAFFAIWLDPRARDPQLRQRLLGLTGSERGR